MKTARILVCAASGAAMLAVSAGSVMAQARSTTRIPISKEGPAPRVDTVTVTVYKTDTLRLQGRVDTVMVRGRVDTVVRTVTQTRVDTVAPLPTPIRLPNGFYFGLGGGVNAPAGALYNPNSAGPAGQVQLGWQSVNQPFGIRVDGNYGKFGEDALYSGFQADPEIVNMSADITLALPWFTHALGLSSRFSPYLLGGGTYTMFKNLPIRVESGGTTPPGGVPIAVGTNEWQHNGGFNVGLGGGVMWGRTQIFVESRLMAFKPSNTPQARQFPTIVGINIF
jgi:hypothetical protein